MRFSVGWVLILGGLALVVLGLLMWSGAFAWFGRLPGDIRIERPHARIYVPITSMVLVSIALTVLLNLVRRLK